MLGQTMVSARNNSKCWNRLLGLPASIQLARVSLEFPDQPVRTPEERASFFSRIFLNTRSALILTPSVPQNLFKIPLERQVSCCWFPGSPTMLAEFMAFPFMSIIVNQLTFDIINIFQCDHHSPITIWNPSDIADIANVCSQVAVASVAVCWWRCRASDSPHSLSSLVAPEKGLVYRSSFTWDVLAIFGTEKQHVRIQKTLSQ